MMKGEKGNNKKENRGEKDPRGALDTSIPLAIHVRKLRKSVARCVALLQNAANLLCPWSTSLSGAVQGGAVPPRSSCACCKLLGRLRCETGDHHLPEKKKKVPRYLLRDPTKTDWLQPIRTADSSLPTYSVPGLGTRPCGSRSWFSALFPFISVSLLRVSFWLQPFSSELHLGGDLSLGKNCNKMKEREKRELGNSTESRFQCFPRRRRFVLPTAGDTLIR
ncbi:hypothetical protein QBC38DRAFT_36421 [Podospora fimiseda]|uniref:Uncharacterized protein n=1 Tax=Podospora fimiseda TaxID=252190 RepID=A0AAN7BIH4_9PEZI|nr:hypothetical protein QBC38DRAFT_36421 [Podospora fimiseda]